MRFPAAGTELPYSLGSFEQRSHTAGSSCENKRELHPLVATLFVTGGEERNLHTGYMAGLAVPMAGYAVGRWLARMDEETGGFYRRAEEMLESTASRHFGDSDSRSESGGSCASATR